MMNYGLINVAACTPEIRPGDVMHNADNIIKRFQELTETGAEVIAFPELCVTGYTCADLFLQELLLQQAYEAIERIAKATSNHDALMVIGAPLRCGTKLYNCAIGICNGRVTGASPKIHLPNYGEFYEKRWFSSGSGLDCAFQAGKLIFPVSDGMMFSHKGILIGAEICEDLWVPEPPSGKLCKRGADIILNLSATNEGTGKHSYLLDLIRNQSARCRCAYVYASSGVGESSTDLCFSGNCIIAEEGKVLMESKRFDMNGCQAIAATDVEKLRLDRLRYNSFSDVPDLTGISTHIIETGATYCKADCGESKDITGALELKKEIDTAFRYRRVDPHPFVDSNLSRRRERCEEISSIQAWGLATRLRAIGCKKAVLGISGGLDSTLALLVTVKAFDMLGLDRKGIIAITMPGFGTTERTFGNAMLLMERLGVTSMEIGIGRAVKVHFEDIGQDPEKKDVTYENSQARERTQILMDMANKCNGIVIGTGDLSELALGWCTYNGDQMSMYGVNASVPKTLVKYLVETYADLTDDSQLRSTLLDIIDTPISPELLPAGKNDEIDQKTEDLVGPYELHDFFLHAVLRNGFSPAKIYAMATIAFDGKYDGKTIIKWLRTFYRRFFQQQFKRSCMPDGVKVGSVCLSPRGDWRMPSDASRAIWDRQCQQIEETICD